MVSYYLLKGTYNSEVMQATYCTPVTIITVNVRAVKVEDNITH